MSTPRQWSHGEDRGCQSWTALHRENSFGRCSPYRFRGLRQALANWLSRPGSRAGNRNMLQRECVRLGCYWAGLVVSAGAPFWGGVALAVLAVRLICGLGAGNPAGGG